MIGKSKDGKQFPPRPKVPTAKMMELDIVGASSDDPVFTVSDNSSSTPKDIQLKKVDINEANTSKETDPSASDSDKIQEARDFYPLAEELLQKSQRLQNASSELRTKYDEVERLITEDDNNEEDLK